jgi:hypothetical protein
MLLRLFTELRQAGAPVSLKEYLALMEAMDRQVIERSVDDFYHLARAVLIKDETHYDRYDRVFGHVFKGLEFLPEDLTAEIPEEWLRKLTERFLTEEEKAEIEALGGLDKLMETLRQRLEEQKERHQGGSKWIGTGGTSPFGAYGYNPEGVRIGQDANRNNRAVKVWDRREFRNLDDSVELGTRNIKVALRKLRRFARDGAAEELDLDGTIDATARQGWLDVRMRPERRNAVKLMLLLDVGGSMDPYIRLCEELFSAARSEFKNLEFFYFHNCPYEGLWKDNARRRTEKTPTWDVLHRFPHDWRVVFVGDASMSPYELALPGGSVEHWNEEPGQTWLSRFVDVYDKVVWLNPVEERWWGHTASIAMVRQLVGDRMHPLTLEGLDRAIRDLR